MSLPNNPSQADVVKAVRDLEDNSSVFGDTLPIGSVIEWDSDVIPENWLLLNGQAVSRTDYSELFELYGTRYGIGDGSTTFNLPNRQNKVAVGKNNSDSDFDTLGKTGGEKTHKLTVAELPSHAHNAYSDTDYKFTLNLKLGSSSVGRRLIATSSSSDIYALTGNNAASDDPRKPKWY